MSIDRIPCNIKAEKNLIGMIIKDNKIFYDFANMNLKPVEFYHDLCRRIFQKILSAVEKNTCFDLPTLASSLNRDDAVELMDIVEKSPFSQNPKHFATEVRNKATLRLAKTTIESIKNKIAMSDSYSEITSVRTAISDLNELVNNRARDKSKTFSMIESITSTIEQIEQSIENFDEGKTLGVTSGFKLIDALLFGLQKGKLYILAARPGMGKTQLAINFAKNAALKKKKVVYFTLEMPKEELTTRLISAHAQVDLGRITRGDLNDSDLNKISKTTNVLSNCYFDINDASDLTFNELITECRYLARKENIDEIFIDYLTLLDFESNDKDFQRVVSTASRKLKVLSKEIQVPIVVLCQLNRDIEKGKPRPPRLSDLRESGSLEQDADVVMFIDRPSTYDNSSDSREAYLHVKKHRGGKTGIVPLYANMALCSFYDVK
jgi:replicative DNA helicase